MFLAPLKHLVSQGRGSVDFSVVVWPLNHVQLFAMPWAAAYQVALSFTMFRSSFKLVSLSRWCYRTISTSVVPLSFWLPSFLASGSFPKSRFFTSCGQKIGVSASASVLSINIQDWFPLRLTGLIFLQSKVLSRVFSSMTIQKHQFLCAQPSLWSDFHIHTWLLEKPKLWLCRPLLAKWYLCFLIQLSGSVSVGKESACNAGDLCSVPGWRRFPGEGISYALQYSCLEYSMDRGSWWANSMSQIVRHDWRTDTFMVFPVVMYGCESWTIKEAEHWRTDVFELWCWRRLLRVSWTARRSNQSS